MIRALRAAGHDVQAAAEVMGGQDDVLVAAEAHSQDRILLTEDRDFGHLVFVQGRPTAGVILIRWPRTLRARLPAEMVRVIDHFATRLAGAFVVVRPGSVRVRPHPGL